VDGGEKNGPYDCDWTWFDYVRAICSFTEIYALRYGIASVYRRGRFAEALEREKGNATARVVDQKGCGFAILLRILSR